MSDAGKVGGPKATTQIGATGSAGANPLAELAARFQATMQDPAGRSELDAHIGAKGGLLAALTANRTVTIGRDTYYDTGRPDVSVRLRAGGDLPPIHVKPGGPTRSMPRIEAPLRPPLVDVAASPVKAKAAQHAAEALLDALASAFGKVPMKEVTVVGYGAIGKATAQAAKDRGLDVTVYDAGKDGRDRAAADGFPAHDDPRALRTAGGVLDTTGALKGLAPMFPDAEVVTISDVASTVVKKQALATIADGLLDALHRTMGKVPYDAVTVAGYGAIGKATAQAAKERGLQVNVFDASREGRARAAADGFPAHDDVRSLRTAGPVVDSTGMMKGVEPMFPDADIVSLGHHTGGKVVDDGAGLMKRTQELMLDAAAQARGTSNYVPLDEATQAMLVASFEDLAKKLKP